jgi:phage tail sheath protein FI
MSHGVSVNEVATGVKPPVSISAGLACYVGTAPINSVDLTNVNKVKLVSTLAEFEASFGALSDDFASWTLHEAAKAHFSAYAVAPIVCINVLDPDNVAHVVDVTAESHQLVDGEVQLQVYGGADAPMLGILASTVVVKDNSGVTTYTLNSDYTLAFDDDGFLVVTRVSSGRIGASDVIKVDFNYLDPSGVTTNDVIGGYSGGTYTGLELIEQVYPTLRLIPGFILAPKYSSTPAVAAAMQTKAASINGAFQAMALIDLPTDGTIATYADAPAWKTTNGYTSKYSAPCWPLVKNGSDVYHGSVVAACVANVTDSANDDIPFVSPSNKAVTGTSTVLDDGTEVFLTRPQANSLNDQGIVTFINGFNGWRLWGNRTGAYPSNTDPKDAFIAIRRMFNWISNTIILTTDANVDAPINRRLVDLVQGTITSYLNGLVSRGALVDGVIEFRADENPTTDLSDGKIVWHVTLTPPSPAEQMEFTLEYDPSALDALFAS